MTMSGLMRTVSIGIWTAFALVDCSSVHRVAFTREHQDLAGIPGIADARTWADDPGALSQTAPFNNGNRKPMSIDVLALSGGGAEGAFGAGLLVGWTEAGNRPEFSIVSGTSSGALIAPFAFLGASHDGILRDLFTSGIAETKAIIQVDYDCFATSLWPPLQLPGCSRLPILRFSLATRAFWKCMSTAQSHPTFWRCQSSVLLRKIGPNAAKPNLYIIVNGKITSDFAMMDDGICRLLRARSTRRSRRIRGAL
jgi:hypothetical protein